MSSFNPQAEAASAEDEDALLVIKVVLVSGPMSSFNPQAEAASAGGEDALLVIKVRPRLRTDVFV